MAAKKKQPFTIIVKALENPLYKWRTISGVAKELKLNTAIVRELILENQDAVILADAVSPKGEELYTTRQHFLKNADLGEKLKGAFKNRLF